MKSECTDSVGLCEVSLPCQQTWCFIKIFIPCILPPVVFLDLAVTSVQTIVLKAQYCLSTRAAFKAQANNCSIFTCSMSWAVPRIYNCSHMPRGNWGQGSWMEWAVGRKEERNFHSEPLSPLYLPHVLYLRWHLPVLPPKVSRTRV